MKTFFAWLLLSSKDATKYSLFIKSLVGFVPTVVLFLSIVHIHVDPASLIGALDILAVTVTAIGSAILAVSTLWGAIRKIGTTVAGTNDVLNSQ